MQPSSPFSDIKKALYPVILLGMLSSIISFDTQPRSPRYPGDASLLFDAGEEVERFMATASDSTLTILNGNLWMLPGGLSIDKEQRIDRFVSYARQLMPHVITLQEIWTTDLVAYLKVRFPEFHVVASGEGGPVNAAGLVTLSRVSSDSAAFTPFAVARDASLIEKRAGKGYLTVRVATPAFKARIVNTHLYAPTCQQDQAFVAAQFNTLKQIDTNDYTFIVGDLNLAQRDFERLNDSFFVTEKDTSHTVNPANPYTRLGVNARKKRRSYKIDRLLMPQAHAGRFAVRSMLIHEPVVSDHYLLAYRIEYRLPFPSVKTVGAS